MTEACEENLVIPAFGCPSCGERRVEELWIDDDERVECETCGRRYYLPAGPEVEE